MNSGLIFSMTFAMSVVVLSASAKAEQLPENKNFRIGGHSMLATGSIDLSRIVPSFDDLNTDGIDGPHHSSIYFLVSKGPSFRVGGETLTGNSTADKRTTMSFQGIGLLLDWKYGNRVFLTGGVHAGAVIVNVMSNDGASTAPGVQAGSHFKDNATFLAPYVGIGYEVGDVEISLISKWLELIGGERSEDTDAFSSNYAGVGIGLRF